MRQYSPGFKAQIVGRTTGPSAIPVRELADELGINRNIIYRWRRNAQERGGVSKKSSRNGTGRSDDRPPSEKLRLVMEANGLSEEELGEFLRRNGLHEAQLTEWRETILGSLGTKPKPLPADRSYYRRKIKELEREVHRKDKALAEVTALLALKKKAEMLWGDEDGDTPPPNEDEP